MTVPAHVNGMTAPSSHLKNYHSNLAAHLASLIKRVHISQVTSSNLPEAPPNNRQHSDESLESASKVSSGVTTESKESGHETAETSVGTKEEDKAVFVDGISPQPVDAVSPTSRNDLTARPDRHPPHFSPSFHDAEVSSAGPSRSGSRSSRSSNASPKVVVVKPSRPSPTRSELETREDEQRRAWELEGRRVWRSVPKGFELKLERKKRTGSNDSSLVVPSICTGLSGAGPGTALRADGAPATNAVDMERVPSNVPTTVESASEISQAIPASTSSVSGSLVKTGNKPKSTLQRRQAKCQEQDNASIGRSRQPTSTSQEEHDEYLRKRNDRLSRRQDRLEHNIKLWWADVQANWSSASAPSTPPDIPPHLPSPGLASTQLRFLPLGSNMPDLFDHKGPTLKLPPLNVIGDTRRNRLHIIGEQGTESDVDLLIRLSEINQRHGLGANMYTRNVLEKMPSPPLFRSRDERTDASRVHSLNVTTSMPTPKPNSNRTGYM